MRVCVAHKGFVGFEIETHGRAAHGSRPDLGVDAIAKMGHVLVSLDALDRSLRERPAHRLLGSGSVHAGVIAGGAEFSTYPARCVLKGERRTVPGESLDQVEAELQELLDRLSRADGDFEAAWRVVAAREPFEVPESEEIVRLVRSHAGAGEVVGRELLGRLGPDRGGGDPDRGVRPGWRGRARRRRVGVDRGRRALRSRVRLGRCRVLRLKRSPRLRRVARSHGGTACSPRDPPSPEAAFSRQAFVCRARAGRTTPPGRPMSLGVSPWAIPSKRSRARCAKRSRCTSEVWRRMAWSCPKPLGPGSTSPRSDPATPAPPAPACCPSVVS